MISQTGEGLFQERIAEERGKALTHRLGQCWMNSEETIIAEYGEKVLHHELLAAQAETRSQKFYK